MLHLRYVITVLLQNIVYRQHNKVRIHRVLTTSNALSKSQLPQRSRFLIYRLSTRYIYILQPIFIQLYLSFMSVAIFLDFRCMNMICSYINSQFLSDMAKLTEEIFMFHCRRYQIHIFKQHSKIQDSLIHKLSSIFYNDSFKRNAVPCSLLFPIIFHEHF